MTNVYDENKIYKLLSGRNPDYLNKISSSKEGKVELVKLMASQTIKVGQNCSDNWNEGFLALCVCLCGHLDIVKYLIEKELYDINYGFPLACKFGRLDIVKYLDEKGVNDFVLATGLSEAISYGQLEIVQYLVEKGFDNNLNQYFVVACLYGQLDIVKYLFEKGVNDNEFNLTWINSGFNIACKYGYLDIVTYLVEKGVNDY